MIVFARFLPVVRSVAPVLAGAGKMHYPAFLFYNVIGGFIWAVGLTMLGFFLGSTIPNVDRYLIPLVLLIMTMSVSPGIVALARNPDARKQIKMLAMSVLRRGK